ncbi:hypothetical protein [Methylomicrobium lacus]
MSKLVIDLSQPAPVPQSLEEAQQLIAALWQLLGNRSRPCQSPAAC